MIKRIFSILFLTLAVAVSAVAQTTIANDTPIRFVSTLPTTCTPTVKASVLIYKTGTASGLYRCSAANTWTQATGTADDITNYASLAAAVTAIGATPKILTISTNTTCSTALTIPATLIFNFTNSAKITESGTCTINFQGIGIASPESQTAIFSSFENGDITWTGTVWPQRISTELFDTGNASLLDRLNLLNSGFGTKQTTFVCYPRTITGGRVNFNENKEIYLTPGDYPGSYADAGYAPFGLNSNVTMRGTLQARLQESVGSLGLAIVGINNNDLLTIKTNIVVENLTFYKNPSAVPVGGPSTVILGNCHRCAIRNNVFDEVNAYGAIMGGYGTTGNYAFDSAIEGNKFYKVGTQTLAFINASNSRILNNHITLADSPYGGCVIDLEPNNEEDFMNGNLVEGNLIDASALPSGGVYFGGICIQATTTAQIETVVVRGNTFLGRTITTSGADAGKLTHGVSITGAEYAVVESNIVRGAFQSAYIIADTRYLKFTGNSTLGSADTGDVSPFRYGLRLQSVADSEIHDNVFKETYIPYDQSSGAWEQEIKYAATGSGSTVTRANIYDSGARRFYDHMVGLTTFYNGSTYAVSTVNRVYQSFTMTGAVGTTAARSALPADINTSTETITITTHGFTNGQLLKYSNQDNNIGLTHYSNYFVVGSAANTFQLSLTSGGAAIDLTSQGIHPHTFIPTIDSTTGVATGTERITLTGHGFNNGCLLKYIAGTTPIGGLTDGTFYYVVGTAANDFQVAATLGGSAINLTSTGTGFQAFVPAIETRFSSNTYKDNYFPDGYQLEPNGTSQILSNALDTSVTNVADAPYTALVSSGTIVYTSLSTGRTVTLPSAATLKGKKITVKDGAGSAATNNITLDGNGSETIDGAATAVIKTNYGTMTVQSNGVGWITLTPANQTGSGSVVLSISPALTTPNIGVASGTSLALGGGTALTTTNQTGTGNLALSTGPTLTSPRIGTSVNDTNGNEIIKTPATVSAVNEITVTNAATGTGPTISATGDDTNIDLNFTPKGTGRSNFLGGTGSEVGLQEGTPAGAATGYSVLSANSTGNRLELSNNNGAFSPVVTQASTDAFTNKTLDAEATGNVLRVVSEFDLATALCNNVTATTAWNLFTSLQPTPVCITGSNTQLAALEFPDSDGDFQMQTSWKLPATWSGALDINFLWSTALTTGDVVLQYQTACAANDESPDPAFNTAQTITDTALGTANRLNTASATGITTTGCAAGETLYLKVFRNRTHASDTLGAGTVRIHRVTLTYRKSM